MAKYYLTLNSRPFTLKTSEVRWDNKYKVYNPNKLKSIDNFCMEFSGDADIKLYLKEVAIEEYYNGKRESVPNFMNDLNIRYINRGAILTLSYGIPYKKDNKYFDYEYLREKLLSLRSDYLFLQRLIANFKGAPIQEYNMALFHRASIAIKNGNRYHDEDKFYNAMMDFIKLQIFKYDKTIHDYSTDEHGTMIYKWRQLHDLAMFIKNYEEQKQKETTKIKKLYELDNPKQLSKGMILGQLSLFDN